MGHGVAMRPLINFVATKVGLYLCSPRVLEFARRHHISVKGYQGSICPWCTEWPIPRQSGVLRIRLTTDIFDLYWWRVGDRHSDSCRIDGELESTKSRRRMASWSPAMIPFGVKHWRVIISPRITQRPEWERCQMKPSLTMSNWLESLPYKHYTPLYTPLQFQSRVISLPKQ